MSLATPLRPARSSRHRTARAQPRARCHDLAPPSPATRRGVLYCLAISTGVLLLLFWLIANLPAAQTLGSAAG